MIGIKRTLIKERNMSECCIIGAGSSKYNALPNRHNFYISANLHYPDANIIFAQDNPILDKILKKRIDGFCNQPVFTTPQKYRDYKDFNRCYMFDYRHFYNTGSLSSGLNAVVLAQFLGFTHIYLAGFDFTEKKKDYSVDFETIKGDVKYTFL